jgi:hypothetical protein
MKSIPAVIDALGGAAAIARSKRIAYTTVASWKARGRIPPDHWPAIVDLAKRHRIKGVTIPKLQQLYKAA